MSVIAALSGLIGAGISAGASIIGTHMKNEAQKRENEVAFRRNQAEIDKQNAYNSPSAQMARMSAAGLNPNLMYQQGDAGLQEVAAQYQPAEYENAFQQVGNVGEQMVNNVVSLREMENNTKLTESQIALNSATTGATMENAHFTRVQADRMAALLGWELKRAELDNALVQAETNFKVSQTNLTNEQIKNLQAEYDRIIADIDLIKAKTGLTDKEIENLDAETRFLLARLPYADEFARLDVQARRQAVMLAGAELELMRWSAKNSKMEFRARRKTYKYLGQENMREWINTGAQVVLGAGSVASNFLMKGSNSAQSIT